MVLRYVCFVSRSNPSSTDHTTEESSSAEQKENEKDRAVEMILQSKRAEEFMQT